MLSRNAQVFDAIDRFLTPSRTIKNGEEHEMAIKPIQAVFDEKNIAQMYFEKKRR